MITLNLTPNQYETICVALKLADMLHESQHILFMSESFENVLNDIKPNEIEGQESPTKSKKCL